METMKRSTSQIQFSDLIGLPYTRDHDCNWLAAEIFSRFGLSFPEIVTPKDSSEWEDLFNRSLIESFEPTPHIIPCTLLTFCFPEENRLGWHVGTMLDKQRMITTTARMGVHIINRTPKSPYESIWWAYFRGSYRLK